MRTKYSIKIKWKKIFRDEIEKKYNKKMIRKKKNNQNNGDQIWYMKNIEG
jgi:hypothetical protein